MPFVITLSPQDDEHVWGLIDALEVTAQEARCTVAQVAIRWLMQKRSVASVVIGAKNVKQLEDNLGAGRVRLTDAQMARLDDKSECSIMQARVHSMHR